MPPWYIKAAVQGTLARLPNPQRWNRLFQAYVTRSLRLTDTSLFRKWGQTQKHAAIIAELRPQGLADSHVVELGTGWYPISPIALALAGAKQVWTIDQQSLLAHDRVVQTLDGFARLIAANAISVPPAGLAAVERLHAARKAAPYQSATELLGTVGINSLVGDARTLELPQSSIDVFISNNTLEHIPREVLGQILQRFRTLASPTAIMSHFIDMADHYTEFDKNITVYNYLKFSEPQWKWFNHQLQYQNRLRLSDYCALHENAGWRIAKQDNTAEPLSVLRSIPLAPPFRKYAEADLAVYESWLAATLD